MRFNKQKMLSGVLATGLALSCMAGSAFAADPSLKDAIKDAQTQVEAGLAFSDVKQGDWYYDAVMDMTEMGLFAGTGDGKFSPNNTMTCGEFLTVVVRYLYPDELSAMGAVPSGAHWADNARLVALDKDIISNNEMPEGSMSKEITRDTYLEARKETSFAEVGTGVLPIQEYIDAGNEAGIPYILLEQDFTFLNQMDSVRISMESFRKYSGIEWS